MSLIQKLLDKEATLGNEILEGKSNVETLKKERKIFLAKIIKLRGTDSPSCWGEDDCSTMMLVRCPWRIDCGTKLED